jgi:ubiquinone/menaquinone biosynthesis C-methylase UbiE
MALYDQAAEEYAAVFDHISLRLFEWPWIKKQVARLRPRSLLDLGCGNGYLSKALIGTAPEICALEPSPVMCALAKKTLGDDVDLRQGQAESMPFGDNSFDMVISLLSFRYMVWDKALDEIYRVLKKDGFFILVDLFASSFTPLYFHKYIAAWAASHFQYIRNSGYCKKLRRLTQSGSWRKIVQEHPKRNLSDASVFIQNKFFIKEAKILSAGLRGKTAGFICGKT